MTLLHKRIAWFFFGYLKLNDPSDLVDFKSVSELKFHIEYEGLSAPYMSYVKTTEIRTDDDGCFEVKLPKPNPACIAKAVFTKGYFLDCYFNLGSNSAVKILNLKSSLISIDGAPYQSICLPLIAKPRKNVCPMLRGKVVQTIRSLPRSNINRVYYAKEIEQRGGVEAVLKDIH